MSSSINRRTFVVRAVQGALGLALGSPWPGCGPREDGPGPEPPGPAPGREPTEWTYVEGSAQAFPYFRVSGTPREIGRGIGSRFGELIRLGFERRAGWFAALRDFAMGPGRDAYEAFVAAARSRTPRAFEELRGWAEGSGVAFEDLMVLNIRAEVEALIQEREAASARAEPQPGCSTVVLAAEDRLLHLHNEDGHDAYADLMFVLDVRPSDGVPYVALSYPGILPGNAPGVNAFGVAQTTNFIACREVRLGVGRHFLDRMILEARSLDEAIEWASHPERAYGFHHVFTSLSERRAVGIEVTPSKVEIVPIAGLYYHTNHLVFEGMTDEDQDEEYVGSSSTSRWRVIEAWARGIGDPAALGLDDLVAPLASHEGSPYSPCRHPEGDVRGFTLATAVFQAPGESFRLSRNQPCLARWTEYDVPAE